MPVDLYVGGVEHAVLHLLYSRFWHKVLYDLNLVSTPEPFRRLINQGYILAAAYRDRSEEHTSELQSQSNLVCRLLLEKKKKLANKPTVVRRLTSTIGTASMVDLQAELHLSRLNTQRKAMMAIGPATNPMQRLTSSLAD